MTLPQAIFGGLALIAVSIYFSVGTLPLNASSPTSLVKVTICDQFGTNCHNGR